MFTKERGARVLVLRSTGPLQGSISLQERQLPSPGVPCSVLSLVAETVFPLVESRTLHFKQLDILPVSFWQRPVAAGNSPPRLCLLFIGTRCPRMLQRGSSVKNTRDKRTFLSPASLSLFCDVRELCWLWAQSTAFVTAQCSRVTSAPLQAGWKRAAPDHCTKNKAEPLGSTDRFPSHPSTLA